MIQKGVYVKAVFRNSMQIEGTVESWSDEESVLLAEDGMSKCYIFHTKDDIIALKVYEKNPAKITHKKFEEVVEQFNEVLAGPSDDDLRLKNLAELKALMNEQEKKIITEKIKSHTVSDIRPTQYGLPFFTSKQRTK